MRKLFLLIISLLIIGLAGCSKSDTPESPADKQKANQPGKPATAQSVESDQGKIDACALLTSKEIESIQGEPLKETKRSGKSGPEFSVSQCYFSLPTSSNSISLMVTQKGDDPGARDPKELWKEKFHRDAEADKGREEGEKKRLPPDKISGVGDEAFWVGSRFGGNLYVLTVNSYIIRISVGGADEPAIRLKKSKDLAEMVLKRLR
jgi:hypothetical protein